jgi:hypothetical protein
MNLLRRSVSTITPPATINAPVANTDYLKFQVAGAPFGQIEAFNDADAGALGVKLITDIDLVVRRADGSVGLAIDPDTGLLAQFYGLYLAAFTPTQIGNLGMDADGVPTVFTAGAPLRLALTREAGFNVGADEPNILQTSNATPTAATTFNPPTGSVGRMEVNVFGCTAGGAAVASYVLRTTWRDSGGTPTLVGTETISVQEDGTLATATAIHDVSAGVIRTLVTGVAATTINWSVFMRARYFTPS